MDERTPSAGDLAIRPRDMLWALAIASFAVVLVSVGVAAVTSAPMMTTTVPAPVVHIEEPCQVCPALLVELRRIGRRHDLTEADRRVVDRVTEVLAAEEVPVPATVPLPPPTTNPPPTSTSLAPTTTEPPRDNRPITVTWPTTTTVP